MHSTGRGALVAFLWLLASLTLIACESSDTPGGDTAAGARDTVAAPDAGGGATDVAADTAPQTDTTCVPSCFGRACGDDGCGGLCGPACAAGSRCSPQGLCEPDSCVPDCDGRECGSDGCGGSCGACTAFPGSVCGADGRCGCVPACEGRCCGDDGCGGLCPDACATTGQTCDLTTCSCAGACTPRTCDDLYRECGPASDGCGGPLDCGTCPAGTACDDAVGLCRSTCVPRTCVDLGVACGWTDNGCGTNVDCGGCGAGETCQAGACAPACEGGLTWCDGACVNTTNHPDYCGNCVTSCDPGEVCENSTCAEAGDCRDTGCSGLTYCNLATGECLSGCIEDEQCPTNEHCDTPNHACACDAGWHRCSGTCRADSSVDTCGTSCEPCPGDAHGTRTCTGGTCGVTCAGGYRLCGGACALCPTTGHGAPTCDGGACILACDPGWTWCGGACQQDAPDRDFEDTNCDGIDGDEAIGYFVAPTGRDANAGTKTQPVQTIARGIALANASSRARKEVYIAAGTYDETVTLANGVGLYGGYDAANGWQRSATAITRIRGGATAVLGQGHARSITLQRLTIVSADAAGASTSSYGVRLIDMTSVRIEDCRIEAGDGADGAAASRPGAAEDGTDAGAPPDCWQTGCVNHQECKTICEGGAGPRGPYCDVGGSAGDGGHGGDGHGPRRDGHSGYPGESVGMAAGGPGGAMGEGCGWGNDQTGQPGGPGAGGADGFPAPPLDEGVGAVSNAIYVAPNGAAGGTGQHGAGGGGGGGGFIYDCNDPYSSGSAGAGGGSGGCGAVGGPGGGGGGGSFGILAVGTGLIVRGTTIVLGRGGDGGAGAAGGSGGSGGAGGDARGSGGDGAAGGRGGAGGPGGGGLGGPAVGLLLVDTVLEDDGTQVTGGTAGAGGPGASGGPAGPTGQRSETCSDTDGCVGSAGCPPPCTPVGACDPPCGAGEVCADGACVPDGEEFICENTCQYPHDGDCDDGGPNSAYSYCTYGTDCGDCGPRPVQ